MRLVTTTNRMEAVPSHQNSKMSHMCLFVSGYIPEDSLFVCECVHAWVLRVCFPSTAPDNEHYKLRVTGGKGYIQPDSTTKLQNNSFRRKC